MVHQCLLKGINPSLSIFGVYMTFALTTNRDKKKGLTRIHQHMSKIQLELESNLIRPIRFRQIPNPFHALISTLFKHFQEPDQQSRSSKHDDRKVDLDRRSGPSLTMCCSCQIGRRCKCTFLASEYTWDSTISLEETGGLTSRQSYSLLGRIWLFLWVP